MKHFNGFSYKRKLYIVYLLLDLALLLLSLIGLIWNEYDTLVCLAIGLPFGLVNVFAFVRNTLGGVKPDEPMDSMIHVYAGMLIRFSVIFLSLAASFLYLYFTSGTDGNKLRYLNLLASAVPFMVIAVTAYIVKPDPENLDTPVADMRKDGKSK